MQHLPPRIFEPYTDCNRQRQQQQDRRTYEQIADRRGTNFNTALINTRSLIGTPPAIPARPASVRLSHKDRDSGQPASFIHSLESQIGGQLIAGFGLTDLYEDTWSDEATRFNRFSPVAIATRAIEPHLPTATAVSANVRPELPGTIAPSSPSKPTRLPRNV